MGKSIIRTILLVFFAILCSSCYGQSVIRVSTSGNDANDGSTWALAKKTVQAGIDAASTSGGGEIWVAAGVYNEFITLRGKCYLYGGFAGTETAGTQRDFHVNKSILDSLGNKNVVTAFELTEMACIDGFTIRNSGSMNYGISCVYASPTITNNTISGNDGGIYCWFSSATIANNTISGNASHGIICNQLSNPTITNNTIYCNIVSGIYCKTSLSLAIANNIIAFNTIGISRDSGNPAFKCNCVYGNTMNYSGISAGSTDISMDPLLENWRYGKVHIQPGSPCINAGDGTVVVSSWLDMDGQPRVQGTKVDIGADESDGTTWLVGLPAVLYVSPTGNNANSGLTWALAKKTVQAGIDAASSSGGGEVWVAAGVYNECITLKAYCYLYGGFAGTESTKAQRNFRVNKSILDGSGGISVVAASNMCNVACIDGFTIRNSIRSDVGIACSSASPTIANNTISGNGYGISCSSSNPIITNNTVFDNSDYGISCSSSSPTITNNTIVANTHGVHCWPSSSPAIANNIVGFNGNGIYNEGGTPTLNYNCVYGNTTNYRGISAGSTDKSANPMLENWRYGKVHIQPGSSCIDAGDGSVVDSSWLDMDGQPRVQRARVDIGADEFDGTTWPVNSKVIFVKPTGNNANSGLTWALAKKTVQAGIDAASSSGGGEVWVAAGVYSEHITLKAYCYLYGGFGGTESSRSQRNIRITKSILEGSGSDNIVTANEITTLACVDGFTIKNSGGYWSAIRFLSASPTVANNIICGNGYGIYCESSNACPALINNTMSGNAQYGIYCTAYPAILNNTITASDCGIYCGTSNPTIANNIVAFNNTGLKTNTGTPKLSHNCVYGNSTNYSGVSADSTDIQQDPLLANWRYGSDHIQPGSPCIDAADRSPVGDNWLDIDSQARVQGSGLDIGADESDGTLWSSSPKVFYVSPAGSDVNDGSSWALAKKTVQAGIDAASSSGGGEIWVAAGTCNGCTNLRPYCYLYGGFAGTEIYKAQRNFHLNKSILDGFGNTAVVANATSMVACIDGFTITNSGLSCAHGIFCYYSSPTITNNIISMNSTGISCSSLSSPEITNNTISGNNYGILCGGDKSSNPTIADNTISKNSGCGICCYPSSIATILNNTISRNDYGIYCESWSNPAIINNTISENNSYGIYCFKSASPMISNNIVAFNAIGVLGEDTCTLKRNCVYGNTTNYKVITTGSTDISVDPKFRDRTNGDYHLFSGSPCINAGDDTVVGADWLDIDREPRIIGTHVDIGSDEYAIMCAGIGKAKRVDCPVYIRLSNVVVTAVFNGFYYIQNEERACGIRVVQVKGNLPQVGSIITVDGVPVTSQNGEECLYSYGSPWSTGNKNAQPLLITCKSVGGGNYGYGTVCEDGQKGIAGASGLNNIGLLISICGKITSIDTTAKRLYISDSSATVAVYYGSIILPTSVIEGSMVKVTGPCSCYKLQNGDLDRLILLKDTQSIVPVK